MKLWNYGISVEADFNGDGVLDYSWYGGDDTSEQRYVLFSYANRYRKMDVYNTLKKEWQRRGFQPQIPEYFEVPDFGIANAVVVETSEGLEFRATVRLRYSDGRETRELERPLRVRETAFVYSE